MRFPRPLALIIIATLASLAFRALATTALFEDAVLLVELMRNVSGRPGVWYQAAYVPIAELLECAVGPGQEISALLWASAISAGVGLAFVANTAWRSRSGSMGLLVVLAVAISPGLWSNATRIEVHATQFLGASVLLCAVIAHRERVTLRTSLGLVIASALAVACHNSNLGALPGAAWIAGSGSARDARDACASLGRALGSLTLGAVVGWWINSMSDVMPATTDSIWYLLTSFAVGPTWAHIKSELLVCWFPVPVAWLVAVATRASPRNALRESLPFFAAGVPSLVLFVALGIWTSGGYFTTSMVFIAGAALASAREPCAAWFASRARRRGLAVVVALLLLAVAQSRARAILFDPMRVARAAVGDSRFAAAQHFMPDGGLVLSLDIDYQSVTGRGSEWSERSLIEPYAKALAAGATAEDFAQQLTSGARHYLADGRPILIDTSYEALVSISPAVVSYMDALRAALATSRTFRCVEWGGRAYWFGE